MERNAKIPSDAQANVNTAKEAVALLEAVPEIMTRLNHLPKVIADLNTDGFSGTIENRQITVGKTLPGMFLNPIFRWRNDPAVRPVLKRIIASPTLSAPVRRQLRDVLNFEKKSAKSDAVSDANELALWDITQPGMKIELDKSTGKRRIKVTKNTSWAAVKRKIPTADPLHSYAVELTVSAPTEAVKKGAAARMILCASPNFEYRACSSDSTEFYPQQPGKKTRMSLATTFPASAYGGYVYVIWNGLDNGKHFFIEDIRITELGADPSFSERKISAWNVIRKQNPVTLSGAKVSARDIAGINFIDSKNVFMVPPGMHFRIAAPVKGKGVFRLGITGFDSKGKMVGASFGNLIKIDSEKQYKTAKYENSIPFEKSLEGTAKVVVRLDLRSGNLDFDNIRLLCFQAK